MTQGNVIQIFWEDLSSRKQQEILDTFGDNCNFDVFPIAEIPIDVDPGEYQYEDDEDGEEDMDE